MCCVKEASSYMWIMTGILSPVISSTGLNLNDLNSTCTKPTANEALFVKYTHKTSSMYEFRFSCSQNSFHARKAIGNDLENMQV